MKTSNRFFRFMTRAVLVLIAGVMLGCSKNGEGDDAPFITVADSVVTLAQTSATATLDIKSNCDWQITPDVSWIQLRPSVSGSGNSQIRVIVTANENVASRSGKLSVKSTNKNVTPYTIRVIQLGSGASVIANTEALQFSYAPGTQGLTVTSNVDWTIEVPENAWFSVTPTSSSDERTSVSVTVEKYNETLTALEGEFAIKYDDNGTPKSLKITVKQDACTPSVVLSKSVMTFSTIEAGNDEVSLTAQGTWSVTAPDWITVTPASGVSGADQNVKVAVTKNTSTDERSAKLIFKGLGNAADTLEVNQAGNKPVITCDDALTADCAAGSVEFEINTNYPWSAVVAEAWASMEPASGESGKTVVKFTIEANTGAKRACKITITCKDKASGNSTDKVVTLNQEAYDGDDLSATETANCYIVNKADNAYKFKATVRGNGKSDQESIINVTPINMKTPDLVVMELWRDTQSPLFTNLRMDADKGYIYFSTPETLQNGNAVIALAVMDEFDNTMIKQVLWSWHIWSSTDDIVAKAMPITYGVNTKPAVDVVLMDRNLGAKSNGSLGTNEDVVNSRGLYYQWGRKDPFTGCADAMSPYRDAEKTTYMSSTRYALYRGSEDVTNTVFGAISLGTIVENTEKPSETTSIDYAVANPTIFINGGGAAGVYENAKNVPSNWMFVPQTLRNGSDSYNEWSWQSYLWGNSNNADAGSTYGQKTIYDPCPAGWRVPDRQTFGFCFTTGGYSGVPEVTVNEEVMSHINCAEEYEGWTNSTSGKTITSKWAKNECSFKGFNGGYHIYTGGIKSGETMFFPMAGRLSYDSGNPCSDYSAYGSAGCYATNAQDGYKQYVTRMEIYGPSKFITDSWEWDSNYSLGAFPGGNGHPLSSFHQAAGYSVRCMKDNKPIE